jgi:hypothetical protein
VDLAGLGVDQPGLQDLPVAREQCVGQRAVAPEHAVAVQVDQQARHRVEQPLAMGGQIRGHAHQEAAVLPGPFEVPRDEDRRVLDGLHDQPRRPYRRK